MKSIRVLLVMAVSVTAEAQVTNPYVTGIRPGDAAVVGFREFASLPDIGGVAARMMLLAPEPGTRNLFVNDMRGPLYRISSDGRTVALYVNIDDERWGHRIQSQGRERGVQSFAFHPQFNTPGARGFGKFYTWSDVVEKDPEPDFTPGGGNNTHDMVLLEWTAKNPSAATYDGDPPRELLRTEQPFANHNGGLIAFNPLARDGQPDFGMLYVGNGDGGSGGSFDIVLKDGQQSRTFTLNRPDIGLYVAPGMWRDIGNFSSGAICLVLASSLYDEHDYIRDYKTFLSEKGVSQLSVLG